MDIPIITVPTRFLVLYATKSAMIPAIKYSFWIEVSSSPFGDSKAGTIIVVKTAIGTYIIHLFHLSETLTLLNIMAKAKRVKNVKMAIPTINSIISASKVQVFLQQLFLK